MKAAASALVRTAPIDSFCIADENPRKTRRSEDTDRLAANMAAHGQLEAVICYQEDDLFCITAGGTRFAAAKKAGLAELSYSLKPKDAAIAAGLAEQDGHTPLHPADQAEAFAAELARVMDATASFSNVSRGELVKALANSVGRTPRFVEQRLKLAGLHKPILAALRADKISLPQAAAWANADGERQKDLWKDRRLQDADPCTIKERIDKADIAETDRLAKFAGKDYAAAGGLQRVELFAFDDDDRVDEKAKPASFIADAEALKAAARDKLKAAADKFLAEGWSFAETTLARTYGVPPRFTKGKACTTKAEKAKAGVFLSIGDTGEIQVERHLRKPKAEKAEPKPKQPAYGTPEYSAREKALEKERKVHQLACVTASTIVGRTLSTSFDIAVSCALAAMVRSLFDFRQRGVIDIEARWRNVRDRPPLTSDAAAKNNFNRWLALLKPQAKRLEEFILTKMTVADRQDLFAFIVGMCVDLFEFSPSDRSELDRANLAKIAQLAGVDPDTHWAGLEEMPELVRTLVGRTQPKAKGVIADKIAAAQKARPATVTVHGMPGLSSKKLEKAVNAVVKGAKKKLAARKADRAEIGT